MSTLAPVSVDCPRCGAAVAGEVVIVANLGARPDLRVAILQRNMNVLQCSNCNHRVGVVRTVATLDFDRRTWIHCYPAWAEVHWAELATATRMSCVRNLGVAAPRRLRDELPLWRVRVVFGYEDLREKLVIDDAGLDDARVERAKLALLAGRPAWGRAHVTLDEAGAALRFRVRTEAGEHLAAEADPSLLEAALPPGFSEAALGVDPFVSFRRFLIPPRPVDPLTFDLDGRLNPFRDGSSLRNGW
ncbi:MAG: hypothetical protein H6739_28800 [Alphaproteobacteria bacterium]|nr:hypothetical protein [Alphaproteobacteria bacterium]